MNAENNLGIKIKKLRKSMGLTQEQLAELACIDDKHLSKIENGLHLPTYNTLKKISETLKFNLINDEDTSTIENTINQTSTFRKIMKIINSVDTEKELQKYYEVIKLTYKLINNK